ncbi:MAG: hypothetical protein H6622_07705 [Halobacteriovoraceae bacterium]|nr:hypothetical protein [Halobacteriovoraceae bacterium]
MKKMLRLLSVLLAMGAISQTIYSYAQDSEPLSVEAEEAAIMRLIEMKQKVDTQGFTFEESQEDATLPQIKTEEQFKEAFARHALRYIEAIGGQDALIRVIKMPEFTSLRERSEPGI